jgi:hypothetical protein
VKAVIRLQPQAWSRVSFGFQDLHFTSKNEAVAQIAPVAFGVTIREALAASVHYEHILANWRMIGSVRIIVG